MRLHSYLYGRTECIGIESENNDAEMIFGCEIERLGPFADARGGGGSGRGTRQSDLTVLKRLVV